MKKELNPSWSRKEKAEAEEKRHAWEEFFSKPTPAKETPFSHHFANMKIAEVRARHEAELMRYPNVIGVSEGIRIKRGDPTGEPCIVVYVQRKISRHKLVKDDIIPSQLDGVLVDIVEVGKVETLPI